MDGGKGKRVLQKRRLRMGRLKDESVRLKFTKEVEDRKKEWDKESDKSRKEANREWEKLKDVLMKAAGNICGWSKGGKRKTMKWSEAVKEAWNEKWRWEMVYHMTGTDKAKEEYRMALKTARKLAKREFYRKITEETKELETDGGKEKVFKLARKLNRESQDITGAQCLRQNGYLVITEEEKLKVWGTYFEKLLNEENEWDGVTDWQLKDNSEDTEVSWIREDEVAKSLKKMKEGKAAGMSGIVAEMISAAGSVGTEWLTELCNLIVREGHIPSDWKKSILVPVYKGKGDPMECGSYRAIKLLEHAMKVVERVFEQRLRDMVNIDDMQCGFTPGKGTTDAIFIEACTGKV
jgi:hypothetical protein